MGHPDYTNDKKKSPASQNISTIQNKKLAAGIFAIVLGSLGIHKFYLGYTKEGIITLLISLLTCGIGAGIMQIIGLIEGILYLTKTDADFYNTYQIGHKGWL